METYDFRKDWPKLKMKYKFCGLKKLKTMFYHMGHVSWKAESPKSVKKYVVKLTINAGQMANIGVTFK